MADIRITGLPVKITGSLVNPKESVPEAAPTTSQGGGLGRLTGPVITGSLIEARKKRLAELLEAIEPGFSIATDPNSKKVFSKRGVKDESGRVVSFELVDITELFNEGQKMLSEAPGREPREREIRGLTWPEGRDPLVRVDIGIGTENVRIGLFNGMPDSVGKKLSLVIPEA
jgi:hypothetical protein